jgi:fatty acid desaturase
MHPMLHLIASRPSLLAQHAGAYAELVNAEVQAFIASGKRRALLMGMALFSVGVSVVLIGVALMLWGVLPQSTMQAPWVLVAVPILPALLGLVCFLSARSSDGTAGFDNLRAQVQADMALLAEAGAG